MINFGIVGLGRLGKIHAENLAKNVPGSCLIAACSLVEEELAFARNQLGVTETYTTYEEMLDNPSLDAVVIASPSSFHVTQIRQGLEKGLHVFCEKPIGLTVNEIEQIIPIINLHSDQKFTLGFMRRYDASYRYAKKMVEDGEIGEITLIRCYGIDPSSGMDSFLKFAKNGTSGGLFSDMSIHDIDLVRWFTNSEIKKVWALGNNKAYPQLDALGELETGAAMMALDNQAIAILVAGRNAVHGYHVETELIGTKGMIRVATIPEKNLVTVYNEHGANRPVSKDFPERFKEAFIDELTEFVSCISSNRQPEITALDGLYATKVAIACKNSWLQNECIDV